MGVQKCSFDSMGTSWNVSVWDDIAETTFLALEQTIRAYCTIFDHTYSRFIPDSLVCELSQQTGTHRVPTDFVDILKIYMKFFTLSQGAFTRLVGDVLSDLGYDAEYSLKPKSHIRSVPDFLEVVTIVDDCHISLKDTVTIDIGALGKGFAVDAIADILDQKGVMNYLVDGSGDIRYKGETAIKVGLEHPHDAKKVVGVADFTTGAMCSSATNRRTWEGMHHIINPFRASSNTGIEATWVITDTAVYADGLATALFLCPPEQFEKDIAFEYVLLNKELKIKRSPGFNVSLY